MNDPHEFEDNVLKHGAAFGDGDSDIFAPKFQYLGKGIDQLNNEKAARGARWRNWVGVVSAGAVVGVILAIVNHVWK